VASGDLEPQPLSDVAAALTDWQNRWTAFGTEDVPDILYHYTDAAGFHGICRSGSLWASDAAFLNDSSELEYTSSVLEHVVSELKAEYSDDPAPQAVLHAMTDLITDDLRPDFDVCVSCFCPDGDLLSQWRGYPANGGGYAIGFRTSALLKTPGMMRRVLYEKKAQRACCARC
jgi:hypothetical protein